MVSSAYDDLRDSRYLHERMIARIGRVAMRWRARMCAVAAVCAVLFAVYCAVLHWRGGVQIDRAVIENSAHYKESPYNVSLYTWLNDVKDANVSESVVRARENLFRADLLVLVASTVNDSIVAPPMKCADLLSTDVATARFYNDLLFDTAEFLTNWTATHRNKCACAPMFGKSVRYMAFAGSRDGSRIEHAINPVDVHAEQYDALDENFFFENRIDLHINPEEEEDARYNEPRGHYALVRRTKVTITLLDKECRRQKLRVTDAAAGCAQRCFDMLRGIDVRERARMQYARGIVLNKDIFERLEQKQTAASSKDEL